MPKKFQRAKTRGVNESYILLISMDGFIHRSVPEVVIMRILRLFHSSQVKGHLSGTHTAHKICSMGFTML